MVDDVEQGLAPFLDLGPGRAVALDAASLISGGGHGALPRWPRAAPSCEPSEGRLLFGCSFTPNENSLTEPRVASTGLVFFLTAAPPASCAPLRQRGDGKPARTRSERRLLRWRPTVVLFVVPLDCFRRVWCA